MIYDKIDDLLNKLDNVITIGIEIPTKPIPYIHVPWEDLRRVASTHEESPHNVSFLTHEGEAKARPSLRKGKKQPASPHKGKKQPASPHQRTNAPTKSKARPSPREGKKQSASPHQRTNAPTKSKARPSPREGKKQPALTHEGEAKARPSPREGKKQPTSTREEKKQSASPHKEKKQPASSRKGKKQPASPHQRTNAPTKSSPNFPDETQYPPLKPINVAEYVPPDDTKYKKEYQKLINTLKPKNLVLGKVKDDGDCGYESVAQELSAILGKSLRMEDIRKFIAIQFAYLDHRDTNDLLIIKSYVSALYLKMDDINYLTVTKPRIIYLIKRTYAEYINDKTTGHIDTSEWADVSGMTPSWFDTSTDLILLARHYPAVRFHVITSGGYTNAGANLNLEYADGNVWLGWITNHWMPIWKGVDMPNQLMRRR
jgi:hypothetical protein